MNNLSVKLVQRLNKQNNNHGFTLIELLVVIIIIGILSAIALPSFLKQANNSKEIEALIKINAANKIQTNYYYENGEFATNIADLELPAETDNYSYQPLPADSELSIIIGEPKDNQLRYVAGVVFIENNATSYQRICKAYQNQVPNLASILLQKKWDEADAKYCDNQ